MGPVQESNLEISISNRSLLKAASGEMRGCTGYEAYNEQ